MQLMTENLYLAYDVIHAYASTLCECVRRMSLEDHIDITPPTMERDESPEPSTTLGDPVPEATSEEPSEGGSEDAQVEPTEEELRQARLKERALKVGLWIDALYKSRINTTSTRRNVAAVETLTILLRLRGCLCPQALFVVVRTYVRALRLPLNISPLPL